MTLTADQIAASVADAAITDPAVFTKLMQWAKLNLDRQAEIYAQAKAKAAQLEAITQTNAEMEARQRAVEEIDAQITALLS
jgi:hypothetical protein